MEEFYIRIENLLKEQKKTQKEFAEGVGLSAPQAYITLRNRGTFPKADTAVHMAQYLGTTVEYLVTGQEKNPLMDENIGLKEKIRKAREILESPL